MFILDRNVSGGAYALTHALGGTLVSWRLTSGDSAKWHRMSNGDIVASTDAVSDTAGSVCNGGDNANGYADFDTTGGADAAFGQRNIRRCFCDFTVDGASYRFKLLRVGATGPANTVPGDEFTKYLTATGLSNWGLARPLVEGVQSSTNRYYARTTGGSLTSVNDNDTVGFRVYGTPSGTAPTITPEQVSLGVITEPRNVTFQLAGNPSVTASWDGGGYENVSTGVGNVTIDLSSKWESLSLGSHTVLIKTSQNGYKCGAMLTFSKSTDSVSVTTKAHSSIDRPSIVKVASNVIVPDGAVLVRDVTNNANDESVVWETCSADGTHSFANESKTSAQWGLAVRVSIDNSGATTNAEIRDGIAVGVVYERGEL